MQRAHSLHRVKNAAMFRLQHLQPVSFSIFRPENRITGQTNGFKAAFSLSLSHSRIPSLEEQAQQPGTTEIAFRAFGVGKVNWVIFSILQLSIKT